MQTLGARFAHGLVTSQTAADLGCRSLRHARGRLPVPRHGGDGAGRSRGARPHSAPRGARAFRAADLARRRAANRRRRSRAVARRPHARRRADDEAIENAMLVHAAFGGSTNLLIHIPAIAHAAGLRRPTVDDWRRVNASVPRLVDALPNGPEQPPDGARLPRGRRPRGDAAPASARVCSTWMRGPSTGARWDEVLDEWEASERRAAASRPSARALDGVDPEDVISPARARAREKGMTVHGAASPAGTSRPGGSVIKSTAIDPRSARRGRHLPADRAGACVHERERRDRGDQGDAG